MFQMWIKSTSGRYKSRAPRIGLTNSPRNQTKGCIRMCGDYFGTINQASTSELYPVLIIEELFSNLSGGKKPFPNSQAHNQFELRQKETPWK